jgi:hypothetical protein
MALKRKIRKIKKIKKTKKTKKINRRTRRRVIHGGNYEKDFTIRTMFNTPIKAANKVVAVIPGFGVMSAAALIKLNEDLDRNGDDYYA